MHTPTCPPPISWVPSSSRHLAMMPFARAASGGATFPPWTTTVLPVPPPYPFAIRAMLRPASLALPASAAPMVSRMVILTVSTTCGGQVLVACPPEMSDERVDRVHQVASSPAAQTIRRSAA